MNIQYCHMYDGCGDRDGLSYLHGPGVGLHHPLYDAESCGQCTPCREGTGWMHRIVHRIASGRGCADDLEKLHNVADRIEGRTICAFGDAAAWPVQSFLKHFRSAFEAMTKFDSAA